MIVIASLTAQGASTSHSLKHPPSLTINTRYGAYICEGVKHTSINDAPKNTKFFNSPTPCLDGKIPVLEEEEVVLVKNLNLDTLGGLMRAKGLSMIDMDFWKYVASDKKDPESKYWIIYNGIKTWVIDNDPLSEAEGFSYVEIGDFCEEAFSFIKEALLDGHLATRMGSAYIYLQEKLDEESFYKEYPCGLICRKTTGEDVSDLYRGNRVMCVYDVKRRNISVSSDRHIEGFSCREMAASFWGGDVFGDVLYSSSPKYRALGEGEYRKFIMLLVEALSKV